MKNLWIGFNLLLVAAVAVLYYFHFSGTNTSPKEKKEDKISEIAQKPLPADFAGKKTLFINIDTLDKKYDALLDLNNRLEVSAKKFKSKYDAELGALQNDYMDYQKSASAGIRSEEELMKMQGELQRKKESVDKLQLEYENMREVLTNENNKILKDIHDFLDEYAKGKDIDYILATTDVPSSVLYAKASFDITNEVVGLLNTRYNELKHKKK